MSRICVKSRRTNNLVWIPAHMIEEVGTTADGRTFIKRTDKGTIYVYETVMRIQQMMQEAYGQRPQQPVQQVVQVQGYPMTPQGYPIQQRPPIGNPVYRPESRSNKIVDTAVGVGMGMVVGELVGEAIDAIFDIDLF